MKAMKYISAALLTVLVVVVAGCSADRELPKLTGNTAADTPKNSQTLVLTPWELLPMKARKPA